jgi:hypothetical protein
MTTYLTNRVATVRYTTVRAARRAAWAASKDSRGVADRAVYEAAVEGFLATMAAHRAAPAPAPAVAATTTAYTVPVFNTVAATATATTTRPGRMAEGSGIRVGRGVTGARRGFGEGFEVIGHPAPPKSKPLTPAATSGRVLHVDFNNRRRSATGTSI